MKSHLSAVALIAFASLISIEALVTTEARAQQPQPVRIAANVHVLVGSADTITRDNRGRVANAGFIVGPSGVIVIDTGVSYRHGQQLLEHIRSVTDLPVKLVFLTHAVREVVFGAAVFKEIGATIAAHRDTLDLMKARCAQCLKHLIAQLGNEMERTRLVLPTEIVAAPTQVSAGGVTVDVLYFGWSSTPGDIAIFHRDSGTLFAGGLVSSGHVPAIRDADFEGWQHALKELLELPLRHVVPGFGVPAGMESIRATAHYLDALDARSRELYEESSSLLEAIEEAALAEFAGWNAYDPNHRRNALHRRLQLEIEDLGGDPRSTELPDGAS